MDKVQVGNRENHILKRYNFEVSEVDEITPKMWNEISGIYSSDMSLSLEDLKDLNIVKIAFVEGTTYEIQSIGGTASRMMVLPVREQIKGVFKSLIHDITLH